MADRHHLEKSKNGLISENGLTDLYEIWHGDANRQCEAYSNLKF